MTCLRSLAHRFSNAGVAWFNGIMGVFLRWDVLHNQADRIDDMTQAHYIVDTGAEWRRVAASSNPAFKYPGAPDNQQIARRQQSKCNVLLP